MSHSNGNQTVVVAAPVPSTDDLIKLMTLWREKALAPQAAGAAPALS